MNEEFRQKHQSELEKPITMGVLLEYTDEFLIPKFSELMDYKLESVNGEWDKKFASQTHELKSYIDDKLADHTLEMFRRLDEKYQKEKQFRERVVALFKKNNIGSPEDIAYLEGLV